MRGREFLFLIATALSLCGCATVYNVPLNVPTADPFAGTITQAAAAARQADDGESDDAVIGLAFSGGGTRAAAFSYGVLRQLEATPTKRGNLVDRVSIVSGVSGGSIPAAYFGLRGRAALADFRQKFLDQNVMAALDTSISFVNVSRAINGGVNTDNRLRDWFNANLFHDAKFGDLIARGRPIVLINATDIYSRTPFLFAPVTFAATCSDLMQYPVAGAVAASAAVPGGFAPIVVEAFPQECRTPLPESFVKAASDPHASPLLRAYAQSLERARSGQVKYIKLLDGGLVDNYGLSGLTIARVAAGTPYGPMLPEEAVRTRRFLFLVVDAGRGPQGNWAQTLEGPTGEDLIGAVIDTVIDANTRTSYAAFEATLRAWRDSMVRWRCGLKPEEAARLRGKSGSWNCRDLSITVDRISFEQLDAARAKRLNSIPTSFTLPAPMVDELITAGGDALQASPSFKAFLRSM